MKNWACVLAETISGAPLADRLAADAPSSRAMGFCKSREGAPRGLLPRALPCVNENIVFGSRLPEHHSYVFLK